jgi:hypothetical protein
LLTTVLVFSPGEARAQSAPSAPTNLKATTISSSQLKLTWTAASGATNYLVFRGTTSGGEGPTPLATLGNVTSYSDTALASDTSYYYFVQASNGGGSSASTPEVSATTLPATPTGFKATATSSTGPVTLSWNASDNAVTNYQVFRGTTLLGSPTGTTLADTGADLGGFTDDTTYVYYVQALSPTGTSTHAVATIVLLATPTVNTPTTVSNMEIDLSWTSVLGATSYAVLRGPTSGSEVVLGGVGSTTYKSTGLAADTTYFFEVKAQNGNGTSSTSNEVSATTAPAPPTGLTATTLSATTIGLTWTASTSTTSTPGYFVFRTTPGGTFDYTNPVSGATPLSSTSYTDTVVAGASYLYVVRATNANGTSLSSTVASAAALASPTLSAPTTVSNVEIDLSWTAVSGAPSYAVLRGPTSGTEVTVGGAGNTTYKSTGLAADTTYFFEIKAQNGGGSSIPSNEVSATTAPAPPTGVVASCKGSSTIKLTWNASTSTSSTPGYFVYRAPSGGSFDYTHPLSGGTPLATTSYTDTILAVGTYLYVVRASNANGTSLSSAQASATLLGVPTLSSAMAVSSTEIDLSWTAVPGATSYAVLRGTTSGSEVVLVGVSGTSFKNTGLTAGTTYFYEVKAQNGSGSSSASVERSATPSATPQTLWGGFNWGGAPWN